MANTLTSKGQVTIPKPIRDYLGLEAGDAVEFEYAEDGSVRLRGADRKPPKVRRGKFSKLIGINRRGGRTDELMVLLRGYDEDHGDPGLA
jgi:AbrB family looped-hinge helix DNA binding protein